MNLAETHNKEGYFSPTEFEAMKRIESEEKKARRLAAFRPLVYICSPYRGNTNENIENARKYSRFAVVHHSIPIAPHLLFPQFLDDTLGEERQTAMFMNHVLLKNVSSCGCSAAAFLKAWHRRSNGQNAGICRFDISQKRWRKLYEHIGTGRDQCDLSSG